MEHIRHWMPGDAIGPYIVKAQLGGGGSSHVYVASSVTDHNFAVKVCRQNLRELPAEVRSEYVERLSREFNVLQTLRHENIVRVFGFGWTDENDDGLSTTPYIVMEVVEGIPLDHVLEQQQLPLMVLMEIFRKVVGAVAYLHRKQIVHRDIKPSNVVIRENGSPVLIDFGIVRAPWFETLTRPMQILGTFGFLSPEFILSGLSESVYRPKPTDDVYALGVMLYRMLTGAMPVRSSRMQRAHGYYLPPQHPCDVTPQAPRPLGDLAMRMLETDPAKRLQDGQAVLDELKPLLTELRPLLFAPTPERVTESLSTIRVAAPMNEISAATERPNTEAQRSGVLRRVAPWLMGLAVLMGVFALFMRHQRALTHSVPDGPVTAAHDVHEVSAPLTLGERRLPLWDWQKRPPCSEVSQEVDGGCWVKTTFKPPCPKESWERNGECWIPVSRSNESRQPQAESPPIQIPR